MPNSKKSRNWMNRKTYNLNVYKELINDWERGKITADQVLFLAKIDSFIQWLHYCGRIGKLGETVRKYLHPKHGVWLSDQELAKRQGVSIGHISNLLTNLDKSGYIIRKTMQRKSGTKRYLKTCWTDDILRLRKRSN